MAKDAWNPTKRQLNCASLDEFLHHQIIYHESILSVQKGTPEEKTSDYKDTKNLVAELKNLRYKARKIFVDGVVQVADSDKELTAV
jgi:hypothetical protein